MPVPNHIDGDSFERQVAINFRGLSRLTSELVYLLKSNETGGILTLDMFSIYCFSYLNRPTSPCFLSRFCRLAVEGSFAFSFVEGVLVKAIREGKWVLLDEINLASAETLQRLSGLLEVRGSGFIALVK